MSKMISRVIDCLVFSIIAVAFTNAANAQSAPLKGTAAAGAEKSAVCTACHGVNGNSVNPEWPSIAGQNAAYSREQLTMFRDRKRINEIMYPIAMSLTDQDIADLSVYFAAQTPTGLEADPSYYKAGEQLYRAGDGQRGIPSCAACHGPQGRGNPAAGYPALRAQHSVYTAAQLQAYANGSRYQDASDPANIKNYQSRNGAMMVTIAKRLSAEDIRNLASYIQGLR
jgi:cytochrome c553